MNPILFPARTEQARLEAMKRHPSNWKKEQMNHEDGPITDAERQRMNDLEEWNEQQEALAVEESSAIEREMNPNYPF